jgi:hypothetical protein
MGGRLVVNILNVEKLEHGVTIFMSNMSFLVLSDGRNGLLQ